MPHSNRSPIVVGLGEVLWDVFPDGARFGGAPANFACNAAGLGGRAIEAAMVSGVGRDELGDRAVKCLVERGVNAALVARTPQATGTVTIQLDPRGVASYQFAEDTAWDNLPWTEELENFARRTDVVCFGTLGQRSPPSRESIQQFLLAMPESGWRVFDINLRAPYWSEDVIRQSLPLSNVLKCNEDELPVLAEIEEVGGAEEDVLDQLRRRYSLRAVALTRGAEGSLLMDQAGQIFETRTKASEVVDTVGAGDSFTAALALGLLFQSPLDRVHEWASRVSAYVCSQAGATPPLPSHLAWRDQTWNQA